MGAWYTLGKKGEDWSEGEDTSLQPPRFRGRYIGCEFNVRSPRDARDYTLAATILKAVGIEGLA